MSKGKINKPKNPDFPDNLYKKPLEDAIYHVVQTCEVEVENTDWENSDKKLKEEITTLEGKLKDIDKRIGANQGNLSDEIKTIQSEIANLKSRRPLDLIVKLDRSKPKDLGKQHFLLPTLIQILATKLNVYVVGPAGAGKTHAAIQCAKALDVPFHFTGAVASEFKLTGFIDAQGRIVSTEFRKAFENGGLFLFDEIDASFPQAVLAFNAALANDYMDFPDKRVQRHEKFYCIAAANTYGQGADRQYIGRNQLDAASLDRFVFLDWKYDENLERDLAGNHDWTDFVQTVRQYIEEQKIRHIVSPRASIFGAKLLANGIAKKIVEQTILWKGLDDVTKQKIQLNVAPSQHIISKYTGQFTPTAKANVKLKEGEVIGEIEDRTDYYNRKNHKIISPCEGTLYSISERRQIEKGEEIAEIKIFL
ncbi:AAA family ATPase [Candidatus Nomurabacteria bacterium]|nr:AAA family ATPase [Candidatus Nomurabacteria bacterium]